MLSKKVCKQCKTWWDWEDTFYWYWDREIWCPANPDAVKVKGKPPIRCLFELEHIMDTQRC